MESIFVILFCLVINSLLAAFEMAFVSFPPGELRNIAKEGSKMAQWVLDRRSNPERTLSVIQLGITLVALLAAAVGGMEATAKIQPFFITEWGMTQLAAEIVSIFLVVLPLSFFNIVLGELTPKSLALRSPANTVLKGSRWIAFADKMLSPAVTLLEWSTKKVLKVFFPRSRPSRLPQETTIQIGSLSPTHQRAVVNLVSIERKQVQDILVPWREVIHLLESSSIEEVATIVFASGHTRLPVLKNKEVLGTLHTKEFLGLREVGAKTWKGIIHPIVIVKNTDTILPVLRLLQKQHLHMALVVSAKGDRLGIVTMEDIIEAFLGNIFDEDDDSRIHKIFADRVKTRSRPNNEEDQNF